MCSIIASKDKEKFIELVNLNQHRGNFSFSYTEFDNNLPVGQVKGFGEFETSLVQDDYFKVGHVQAPTSGLIKDSNRIHPTVVDNTMLWHNGILTPNGIQFCQKRLGTNEKFDTKLLHMMIQKYGFDILSEIEGLFSCLYFKIGDGFYIFRTKHGKLYVDNSDLSSERFENSKCINADVVYKFPSLEEVNTFKTKRFNFIIKGELN